MAGKIELFGRLDHAHLRDDGCHVSQPPGLDQGVDKLAHHGRHQFGFNGDRPGSFQSAWQRLAPFLAQAVVPRLDSVDHRQGLGHLEFHGWRDQQALAVGRYHQQGRTTE